LSRGFRGWKVLKLKRDGIGEEKKEERVWDYKGGRSEELNTNWKEVDLGKSLTQAVRNFPSLFLVFDQIRSYLGFPSNLTTRLL
jgi:hypothetical protein